MLSQDKLKEVIGRSQLIEGIHERFKQRSSFGQNIVSIRGIEGIGKTVVAQTYVAKYASEGWFDKAYYQHYAWIDCKNKDLFSELHLKNVPQALGVQVNQANTEAGVYQAIQLMANRKDSKILLVFDNINRDDLHKFSTALGISSSVDLLVTSRDGFDHLDDIPVPTLTPKELLQLFNTSVDKNRAVISHGDKMLFEHYLKQVGHNTSAVEFLATAVRTQDEPISALLNSDFGEVLIESSSGPEQTISALIQKLFDTNSVTPVQQQVLRYLICLPDEFIKYEDYKALLGINNYKKRAEWPQQFRASLVSLHSSGWLRRHEKSNSYQLHDLVSKGLVPQLTPSETNVKELLNSLSQLLREPGEAPDGLDRFRWIRFGASVLQTVERIDGRHYDELARNMADALFDFGRYGKAAPIYKTLASRYLERELPDKVADMYTRLANVWTAEAKLSAVKRVSGDNSRSQAIEWLEKVVDVLTPLNQAQATEPRSLKLAKAYDDIAIHHKQHKDYESALQVLRKGLADLTNQNIGALNSAELQTLIAQMTSNLGDIYGEQGQFELAVSQFQQALVHFRTIYEHKPTHSNIAHTELNLAKAYRRQAQKVNTKDQGALYSQALHHILRVVEGGFDRKYVQRAQAAHIKLLREQNKHEEAEALQQQYAVESVDSASNESAGSPMRDHTVIQIFPLPHGGESEFANSYDFQSTQNNPRLTFDFSADHTYANQGDTEMVQLSPLQDDISSDPFDFEAVSAAIKNLPGTRSVVRISPDSTLQSLAQIARTTPARSNAHFLSTISMGPSASENPIQTLLNEASEGSLRHFSVRHISGNDNLCWLRSGWSVVLENTNPGVIYNRLMGEFGDRIQPLATIIRSTAEHIQNQTYPRATGPSGRIQGYDERGNELSNFEDNLFKAYVAICIETNPQLLFNNVQRARNTFVITHNAQRTHDNPMEICRFFQQPVACVTAPSSALQGTEEVSDDAALQLYIPRGEREETDSGEYTIYEELCMAPSAENYSATLERMKASSVPMIRYQGELLSYGQGEYGETGHFERIDYPQA